MPLITFKPSGIKIEVPPGTELLEAARKAGISIDSPCGGKGTCGKCMVQILAGNVDSDSLGVLPQNVVADGYVLACKTKVLDGAVVVEVPEQIGREGGKFTKTTEDFSLVSKELFPERWEYEPLAIKWLVNIPPPQIEDGMSDFDRLAKAIRGEWGNCRITCGLPVLRIIADTIRKQDGLITITIIYDSAHCYVINVQAGDTTTKNYGIAVDVGTTTVAVELVSLFLGEVVAVRSEYNEQVDCGLDVISRINYAKKPAHLEELRRRVLATINRLIKQIADTHGIDISDVSSGVISGNTTMMHLLLGLNPEYIRLEPYTPTIKETPFVSAAEVGININRQAWLYFSPHVGSYVGGDITAGVLCTDLATDSGEISLFIDIGTNGEIVIGNAEFMLTCACSAGPAFEGGGIEFGMRAALGAIEKVEVDAETGKASCETIGNAKAKGICGSGMISLLASLYLSGWIDESGKFNRRRKSKTVIVEGRFARYVIVPASESEPGRDISISEMDIENIIRAKAAIYSACNLMLEQVGMKFEDLHTIYIAGGFGRSLDLEKAMVIGLVPDLPREKFKYIGNAALMGTYMVLISKEYREKQLELARKMTYLELNTAPAYMDQYIGALFLPHTDISLFPTVKKMKDNFSSREKKI
ncbi:MAG: ASKHA domain-containing protein [Victivallales bacterium]